MRFVIRLGSSSVGGTKSYSIAYPGRISSADSRPATVRTRASWTSAGRLVDIPFA